MPFIDPACRCSGPPIFRDHMDCICNIWHDPERLGLSGAIGGRGVLVFAGVHDIHIFSLMCSSTCLGEFRCALSKDHPFLYNSELWGEGWAPFCPVQYWVFVEKLLCWLC